MKRDIIVSILVFIVLFIFCVFSSQQENFESGCDKGKKSNSQVFMNSFNTLADNNTNSCRDIYGNSVCKPSSIDIYSQPESYDYNTFALNKSNPVYASHKDKDKDVKLELSKELQTTISQAKAAAKVDKELQEKEKEYALCARFVGCYDSEISHKSTDVKSFSECENVKDSNLYFGMMNPSTDIGKANCNSLTSLPKKKVIDTDCTNKVYDGNRLGDSNKIAVYTKDKCYLGTRYVGCYMNNPGVHRLDTHFKQPDGTTSDLKTVSECDSIAKSKKIPFFGMEFPQEDKNNTGKAQCILLSILPKQKKTNDDKCINKVFGGNRLGNTNKLAVYSTSRP